MEWLECLLVTSSPSLIPKHCAVRVKPCTRRRPSLLGYFSGCNRSLFSCCSVFLMAACLSQRVVWRNGQWFLSCPLSGARVCFRGVGSASSSSGAISTFKDKMRTIEDLPRVTVLELLYKMVFKGFYNRLHELQVCQSLFKISNSCFRKFL